jgi:hypothetical protein
MAGGVPGIGRAYCFDGTMETASETARKATTTTSPMPAARVGAAARCPSPRPEAGGWGTRFGDEAVSKASALRRREGTRRPTR